jgi:hypothetical protein
MRGTSSSRRPRRSEATDTAGRLGCFERWRTTTDPTHGRGSLGLERRGCGRNQTGQGVRRLTAAQDPQGVPQAPTASGRGRLGARKGRLHLPSERPSPQREEPAPAAVQLHAGAGAHPAFVARRRARCRLRGTDKGIGLEPGTVDATCEMFAQSARTTGQRRTGDGAVADAKHGRAARRRGGRRERGMGRGSRFTVRIPLAKAQSAARLPAPSATEGLGPCSGCCLRTTMFTRSGAWSDAGHGGVDLHLP